MNTKVEEALGVLDGAERTFVVLQQLVVMFNANADYIAAANEIRAARATLAAHIAGQRSALVVALEKQVELLDCIAQQDATIARLVGACDSIADRMEAEDVSEWPDTTRVTVMLTLGQIRNFRAALKDTP